MRSGKRFMAITALGSILLTACGADGGGNDGTGGEDATPASTVTMRDNEFAPADPVIAAGEVELVNEGESPHTFTVEGEAVDVQVDAGQTTTTTVDLEAGSYTVFCTFHRAQGMEGRLTVEA